MKEMKERIEKLEKAVKEIRDILARIDRPVKVEQPPMMLQGDGKFLCGHCLLTFSPNELPHFC